MTQQQAALLAGVGPNGFSRYEKGHAQPVAAESDRVLRVARVVSEAERVFGDATKAGRWLSSVSTILGGKPQDLLATDAGARDVEYELMRIDQVDFA
ncbi:antitoxin Xre/MbcA/ParS toxin-binding domain-containing protein [Stenotrophomonas oahuensis]|uniref:DUF2384 domain-containing protein n=1 Tax=Stenotrophomonas oahuensis TaxID=3003271 RepID=A0ABY9YVJ5_9GAMM|nr:antitoxin Xre/MbcA/ParS toxin-binding domain-containing protein [Stenotrophomonas sp. A5586]WNH54209.1 DUF2384 domain-containing protein [Stenotrophomonas sp. A5586]